MSKDSRENVTPKTEDGTSKLPDIPPEIAQFINGQSVRIDPKRYFAKTFIAALPLIQDRLKESPANTFTLEPKLFEEFISILRRSLGKPDTAYASFKPSDWIAFSLLPIATGTNVDQSSWEDFIDRESIWEDLALPPELNAPAMHQGSNSEERNSNTVSLNVEYSGGEYEPLCLQISVVGDAVRSFLELEAGRKLPSAEKRALECRAKAIWDVLSDKISSRLGIRQLQRGRSLTNQGQVAAFAHDHVGYSWVKVAQALCKDEVCKQKNGHWNHSHWCRERYRKLAALYWKREAAKYAAMARKHQPPQEQ